MSLLLFSEKSIAIALLMISYLFVLIASGLKLKHYDSKTRFKKVSQLLILTAQYGLIFSLLFIGVRSWITWINIVLLILILTGAFYQVNQLRDKSLIILQLVLVLVTTTITTNLSKDSRLLEQQSQLDLQLTKNYTYWSLKADSIKESIQLRNPDPLLSIWIDANQADVVTDQLLYARKVLTEQVTHDFFLEPDVLAQNIQWSADTIVAASWWLNPEASKPAIEDYQYTRLLELIKDFLSYQQFQLDELDEWVKQQSSITWFDSLPKQSGVTALEVSQGLLRLTTTIEEMMAYKFMYFESDEFPNTFKQHDGLSLLIKPSSFGDNYLKHVFLGAILLLTLGLFIPKLTFRLTGVIVLIIVSWLLWNKVVLIQTDWVSLILLGLGSIVLEWRTISSKHEAK